MKLHLVSIHASVKDATALNVLNEEITKVSIHASVKDATFFGVKAGRSIWFQSTHL